MADFNDDKKVATETPTYGEDIAAGSNDVAAIPKGTLDPVYEAKARVLNKAIQDIGMGWVRCPPHEYVAFMFLTYNSTSGSFSSWLALVGRMVSINDGHRATQLNRCRQHVACGY